MRSTVANCLALSLLALTFTTAHAQKAKDLQVKTDTGKVEGAYTTDGLVAMFKGIPYAAPPVGDLRWKAPQPPARWTGVRAATTFGSHCMQQASYGDMTFHDAGESEDCLTLNVWAPKGSKGKKLPVMVWVYGGGFEAGGTSEGRQNGEFLAHRDVIIVSMNYRLSIWGFMVHPELAAEDPHHSSGNYGLLDVVAALQWVQRNAAAFGGDPRNVTLFGESAGSWAVSTEMASPLTKGLFARAIGESGGAVNDRYPGVAVRGAKDSAYLAKTFGTAKLADLRALTSEQIKKAITDKTNRGSFGPDVDGYFLPDTVAAIYKAGKQAQVPLLAGWNANEGGRNSKVTVATYADDVKAHNAEHADDILKLYPVGATDEETREQAFEYATDRGMGYSTWKWIEAQVQTGNAPVYRYFFELANPGDKNHTAAQGAFHSDEIEYVFGALDSRPDAMWRPEDRSLSNTMGQYWTNFAKTGNPNAPGLPTWPIYGPTEWNIMHLAAQPAAKPDIHRDRLLFLDQIHGR